MTKNTSWATTTSIYRRLSKLKDFLQVNRRRLAVPLTLAALLLFLVGGWYSTRALAASGISFDRKWLGVLLAIAPITVVYAGAGLWLMARAVDASLPFGKATVIASYAMLAEALPVPGGAIVRAGALMSNGVSMSRSVMLTLVLAILWISLAAFGSSLALFRHVSPAAIPLLIAGASGVSACAVLLLRQAGSVTTGVTILHRLGGLALIAVRLKITFLALGFGVPLLDVLPFALASIAGSAASVAPSGLGISESLAALVAGSVDVMPAAAFLVVGLDRLICTGAFAVTATALLRSRSAKQAPANG